MNVSVLHVAKVAGISGSENHLLLLLPELRRRGFDVRLAMLHEHEAGAIELADRLETDGVPVERIRFSRLRGAAIFARLVRLAHRIRPAILHTHLVHADFLGLPAGKLARVPVLVSTKHGFNPFRDSRAFARADRAVGGLADVHIAISRGLARYLAEREGFDETGFEVVHYGIEPGPAPPRVEDPDRLAIVGRLIPIKGHEVLLRALAKLRERDVDVTLDVVGEGPLDAELRATVARLGLDGAVRFTGRVSPVGPAFERAGLVVVPSFGEGFGMVALEAMERGRAVVASAVGGLPEIVDDGTTGILVPPGDASALAEAIGGLVADPGRAAAMGAAGRARALETFSQTRCTDRIESLYRAALDRTRDHPRSSTNAASSASTKSHGAR